MTQALPPGLRLYRFLAATGAPLTSVLLARRLKRGKELGERINERRGESTVERPSGALVWLHGASVGELLAVLPLIERIAGRGLNVLVTSGTVTSSELAAQRMPSGVIHQFMPLDVPKFVARFLDHWQPQLALFVESDLWPNALMETSQRKIPMVLVSAMSACRTSSGEAPASTARRVWLWTAPSEREAAAAVSCTRCTVLSSSGPALRTASPSDSSASKYAGCCFFIFW